MEAYFQTAITFLNLLILVSAIYKDWSRNRREGEALALDERKQTRTELQADYDRVLAERDRLCAERDRLAAERDAAAKALAQTNADAAKALAQSNIAEVEALKAEVERLRRRLSDPDDGGELP